MGQGRLDDLPGMVCRARLRTQSDSRRRPASGPRRESPAPGGTRCARAVFIRLAVHRPDTLLPVDLAPHRPADLDAPRRRQHQELQSQHLHLARLRRPHLRDGRPHFARVRRDVGGFVDLPAPGTARVDPIAGSPPRRSDAARALRTGTTRDRERARFRCRGLPAPGEPRCRDWRPARSAPRSGKPGSCSTAAGPTAPSVHD